MRINKELPFDQFLLPLSVNVVERWSDTVLQGYSCPQACQKVLLALSGRRSLLVFAESVVQDTQGNIVSVADRPVRTLRGNGNDLGDHLHDHATSSDQDCPWDHLLATFLVFAEEIVLREGLTEIHSHFVHAPAVEGKIILVLRQRWRSEESRTDSVQLLITSGADQELVLTVGRGQHGDLGERSDHDVTRTVASQPVAHHVNGLLIIHDSGNEGHSNSLGCEELVLEKAAEGVHFLPVPLHDLSTHGRRQDLPRQLIKEFASIALQSEVSLCSSRNYGELGVPIEATLLVGVELHEQCRHAIERLELLVLLG